jgi:ABC-type sugar transport system ATPase subunit
MTVYDNISFPLRLQGRAADEVRARTREAATQVQIEGLLDRRPGQLSGGQQQRVALARALVKQPTLLLLDEPLSNLDAKLRVLMRAEIKRLQRTLGITTILVTHDQIEAMTMADRIAVLKDGDLQQMGTPDDLYYRPATVFVAGFIGTPPMSFLSVTLQRTDGRTALSGDAVHLTATPRLAERLAARSGALTVGVRPEDIRVSLSPSEGAIKGRVLDIEPMGREFVVAVTVGPEVVVALVGHGFAARHDQAVWLEVSPDRLYAFDPATGAAIP